MDNIANNIFEGIVVQNNDPEYRGRVKIFVPHISCTVYENWNKTDVDKIFKFPNNKDLLTVLEDIKKILPWAEYAGPIFGGCASGRFNASTKEGYTSDANQFVDDKLMNGYRPLNTYTNENKIGDAFSVSGKVSNRSVNPYTYNYMPSNYSNLARGTFSIPNVGSHVYVFFLNGDTNYPVFFASSYDSEDIKRIYTNSQQLNLEGQDVGTLHYPGAFENTETKELNSDSKTFRSKHIINSNKNTIEVTDTDGFENIKLTQYTGSFFELGNDVVTRFSTGNDQIMVIGDAFRTYNKTYNQFIQGDNDLITQGDKFEKIGKQNYFALEEMLKEYKEIHEYKRLFDSMRTDSQKNVENTEVVEIFKQNDVSVLQVQQGTYAVCPVCKALPYIQNYSSAWKMSPILLRMNLRIPLPAPGWDGIDIFVPGIAMPHPAAGKFGYPYGRHCPVCNAKNYIYDKRSIPFMAGMGENYIGLSTSTADGIWTPDPRKMAQSANGVGGIITQKHPKIMELAELLGQGGDEIKSIARNLVLNVGLLVNDLPSFRVDTRGKMHSAGVYVSPEKTYLYPQACPHVEHVDVDALPGGDVIITAGNKLKFLVGGNGINIKTFGPIEMYGSISNITAEQMNIMAKHDLFVDGGEKLSLRARNISINPFEHRPVLIEGCLHTSRNMVVAGGAHIDGELGVQHITGPEEWHETKPGGFHSELYTINTETQTVHVIIPDHTQWFASLPVTLTKCKEEARDVMASLGINDVEPVQALAIKTPPFGFSVGLSEIANAMISGDQGIALGVTEAIRPMYEQMDLLISAMDLGQQELATQSDIASSLTEAYSQIAENYVNQIDIATGYFTEVKI